MTSVVRTFLFYGGKEMNIYRVALIADEEVEYDEIWTRKLEKIVQSLIQNEKFVGFYLGRYTEFDVTSASIIKNMQATLGCRNNTMAVVLPYAKAVTDFHKEYYDEVITPICTLAHFKDAQSKKHRWMIENVDLLITYAKKESDEAYAVLQYAQENGVKIINLADEEVEV